MSVSSGRFSDVLPSEEVIAAGLSVLVIALAGGILTKAVPSSIGMALMMVGVGLSFGVFAKESSDIPSQYRDE